MSIFGKTSFDLMNSSYNSPYFVMTKIEQKEQNTRINPLEECKITSLKEAIITYKRAFSGIIPKTDSSQEIHKYIIEIIKKEDEMDLNEKYIFSIYLAMNKHLLTEEIKKDIMEEEFHLVLINWLYGEKYYVEDVLGEIENKNNINTFNIYIGLLINIISIFEILHIKSKDLCEFKFYKKLFKINNFVKLNKNLNINISLSFLINQIENLLKKWDIQLDCFYLAKIIKSFNETKNKKLLGKKTKRSCEEKERDKEDTEAESGSDRGESNSEISAENKFGGLFVKNKKALNINKKVNFDLEINKIVIFDAEEKVSNLFSIKQ